MVALFSKNSISQFLFTFFEITIPLSFASECEQLFLRLQVQHHVTPSYGKKP